MIEPPFKLTKTHQIAIWNHMTEHAAFKFQDVLKAGACTEYACRKFWDGLRASGVLKECGRDGRQKTYTVMDSAQAETWRKAHRTSQEGMLWQAMRSQRVFTLPDLTASLIGADHAPTEETTRKYVQWLMRAGYLKVLEKQRQGVRPAKYQLIKNTGPLPPEPKRRLTINDRNLDRVVYVEGAQL